MEEKKWFYTPLQETLNKIKKDMVFAMGDLNAKVGKTMSDWSR
jgi:hypothetical protein